VEPDGGGSSRRDNVSVSVDLLNPDPLIVAGASSPHVQEDLRGVGTTLLQNNYSLLCSPMLGKDITRCVRGTSAGDEDNQVQSAEHGGDPGPETPQNGEHSFYSRGLIAPAPSHQASPPLDLPRHRR